MPTIRNFAEARDALRAFYHQPGSNTYTLDRMRALVNYLGNPQDSLKIVHVAGTSGKSSTAYYTSSLLASTGAKVGLTVSPHVSEMNERLQINQVPLPEREFCEALGRFIDLVLASPVKPSFFELMIAFAYHEFARQRVDYAVIEVGLGGLIDGTNVISRLDKVCIITDIGYDHTNVLGKTLREIATQKAGIIQPHNHVFIYRQSDEVMDVVRATSKRQSAQIHELLPPKITPAAVVNLPLFQQRNFYLAEQAIRYVLQRDNHMPLNLEQLAAAASVVVPGRMDVLYVHGKTIVLDGAHNGQKMAALVESVRAKFPDQSAVALVAFVGTRDERWQHALDELADCVNEFIVTTFNQESDEMPKQGMYPDEVATYLQQKHREYTIEPNLQLACQQLLARPEPLLLVTGSLYPLGEIRQLIEAT